MTTRTRLRRFAASVLVLWLFGLASGIVNACVVTSGLRHAAHAAVLEEAHEHGAHAVAHGDEHGPQGDAAEPPCERLCDEPAAPTQDDKQQGTPVGALWLPAAPLALVPAWDAPPACLAPWTGDPPGRAGAPITIAYLRLAL